MGGYDESFDGDAEEINIAQGRREGERRARRYSAD